MTLTMVAWILMAISVMAISVWYVPFRLKNLLGLRRGWPFAAFKNLFQ
jgi:hypothetical protein